MKKRFFIFLITIFLLLLFSKSAVLGAASVPEPILPLREAGEYVPRIEELRRTLKMRDACLSFSKVKNEIMRDIDDRREARRRKGETLLDISTRAEFAALEWVYYLTIFLPPTTPQDIWEGRSDHYQGCILTVFGKLFAESPEFLAEQKIDPKKLHHLRATYRAILLKKLKSFHEEFENENLAIRSYVRGMELHIKQLKKYKGSWPAPRKFTEEESSARSDENSSFHNNRISIGTVYAITRNTMEDFEDAFFYGLLYYFGKTQVPLEPYLKLAGYDTEAKRADLLLRMQKESFDNLRKDSLFTPYAAKNRFNPESAKKLALREKERVEKDLVQRKQKWKERFNELKNEEEKLQKEIDERFEKWRKENPNSKEGQARAKGGAW